MSLPPPSLLPLALNDQSDLNSLLAYYRSRIESFEDERREWLQKMEEIREKQDLKHKTEWELKKRREEISELQRTLSEAKLIIFDERQKSLKLTRDNDLMKIREVEDRRKIGENSAEAACQQANGLIMAGDGSGSDRYFLPCCCEYGQRTGRSGGQLGGSSPTGSAVAPSTMPSAATHPSRRIVEVSSWTML